MPFSLSGKTALVTGAGRGIGQATARKLAASGAAVMINDLDKDALFETAQAIAEAGGNVKAMPGDVTAADFPQKLVDATLKGFGSVDILVNNAGYTWDNVIQKTTDEQFQAMLDIHVVAPFRLLRAASGWLREQAKKEISEGVRVMRKVVNVTSVSGTDGNAGQSGYSSGKAAIVGLTKTIAKEWGRYNVNVNAVGFSMIETRLMQPLGGEDSKIKVKGHEIPVGVQPALLDAVERFVPLRRMGSIEEAAGPILFFCSPLSDYVTGECLICGGGARS